MATSGVAAPHELQGCTKAEIASLEGRYGLRLPNTYRRYLELMGHRSRRLFTSDHMAVFYKHVLDLTDDVRTGPAPASFQLPPDAFVVAGRLSACWQFIRCDNADDSPVWVFDEIDWVITQCEPSVLDWLNTWCGSAEDAIRGGYFEIFPNGTTP
jgi:hypothetical protein